MGHVGVCLRGVAGLSGGGGDGERRSSGAAHGRMCVRQELEEAWVLLMG